jgi:hypothetical protein
VAHSRQVAAFIQIEDINYGTFDPVFTGPLVWWWITLGEIFVKFLYLLRI